MRLNAGCGTHYAEGWTNTDLVANANTEPDILVTLEDPFPFPDDSAEQVYLGHVLEHCEWAKVPAFLAEVRRVLQPGGELLATGPDVYRVIEHWRRGREPWALVVSAMEHQELPGTSDWPNALHFWNCHEARLVAVIEQAGFVQVKPWVDPPSGWPVVNWSHWQCAVSAVNP